MNDPNLEKKLFPSEQNQTNNLTANAILLGVK